MTTASANPAIRAGDAIVAAVRPEFVELAPAGDAASHTANRFDGTVLSTSHLGETVQFLVDLGSGLSIQSRLPTPSAPRLIEGDRATVTFSPESVQFFPADSTAPQHSRPEE